MYVRFDGADASLPSCQSDPGSLKYNDRYDAGNDVSITIGPSKVILRVRGVNSWEKVTVIGTGRGVSMMSLWHCMRPSLTPLVEFHLKANAYEFHGPLRTDVVKGDP